MKNIGILIILAAIVVGAYYYSNQDNSFSVSFLGQQVKKAGSSLLGTASTTVASTTQKAYEAVQFKGQELIDEASGRVRTSLYEQAKDTVVEPINTFIKNTFKVSDEDTTARLERATKDVVEFSGTQQELNQTSAGIILPKGELLYFNLKNPFPGRTVVTTYTVDWGDESNRTGEFGPGEAVRVVSHAWDHVGEAVVLFVFKSGTDIVRESVTIVVH